MVTAEISSGEVRVAAGTYEVTSSIQMVEGISILGGYKSDFSERAYQTGAQRENASYATSVTYTGADLACTGSEDIHFTSAFNAAGVMTNATILEGFVINAGNSTCATGVYTDADASITIRYNTINASDATFLSSAVAGVSSPIISNNNINGGNSDSVILVVNSGGSPTIDNNIMSGGVGIDKINAIRLINSTNVTIRNNTISELSAQRVDAIIFDGATGDILDNTISEATSSTDEASGIVLAGNSDAEIKGNNVSGITSTESGTYGIYVGGFSTGTIENNTIDAGVSNGAESVGVKMMPLTYISEISRNTITGGTSNGGESTAIYLANNGVFGDTIIHSNVLLGGVSDVGSTAIEMISGHNSVYNNTIIAGSSTVSMGNVAIMMTNQATPYIENNIIYLNNTLTFTGSGIYEGGATSDPLSIKNNNISGFLGKGYYDFDTATFVPNPGMLADMVGVVSGNIAANPGFADYNNNDFHLVYYNLGGPNTNLNEMGGGLNLSATIGDLDKDGVSRTISPTGPIGSNPGATGWSMGAYEADLVP